MFINKECSVSVIEHIYLSLNSVDIESAVLCDSQFLAIIGPIYIYIYIKVYQYFYQ